jgi:hypothetical protein
MTALGRFLRPDHALYERFHQSGLSSRRNHEVLSYPRYPESPEEKITEWNVPTSGKPMDRYGLIFVVSRPSLFPSRSRISFAALLVKVTARILSGATRAPE